MLLTVKNLTIEFTHDGRPVRAVDGIDFSVKENEIVGIVGESGSGKTVTALSAIDLLPKTNCRLSGEIARNTKIAMIFQEPFTSLNPVMRAGEQIDEAILLREKVTGKEAKERAIKLLGKVKIKDPERVYNSYPHMLSGGQRQRVMIAMALALEPGLLIADEPTTALDVTVQAGILELLTGLKNELAMSVLFITHDFGVMRKIAERILVMKEGKIVERGKREEIFSRPEAEYTRRLLEAVPKIDISRRAKKETPERGTTLMEARYLSKSFAVEKGLLKTASGRVDAVKEASFRIEKGRTLGIVGESGSGKTTLGKLIAGLLTPDSGEISGKDSRRKTQIVFQDPASSLDPRMKMKDIILEGAAISNIPKKDRDAMLRDVLFKVQLKYKDRDKYPHRFSGGEKQRIAIARALAVKPEIIVLDEPVSSLDVIIQSDIIGLLKHLQKELFLTYVFISHDLRIVGNMADFVAVMRNGEIVEYAPGELIYSSPRHEYTKKLISGVL